MYFQIFYIIFIANFVRAIIIFDNSPRVVDVSLINAKKALHKGDYTGNILSNLASNSYNKQQEKTIVRDKRQIIGQVVSATVDIALEAADTFRNGVSVANQKKTNFEVFGVKAGYESNISGSIGQNSNDGVESDYSVEEPERKKRKRRSPCNKGRNRGTTTLPPTDTEQLTEPAIRRRRQTNDIEMIQDYDINSNTNKKLSTFETVVAACIQATKQILSLFSTNPNPDQKQPM